MAIQYGESGTSRIFFGTVSIAVGVGVGVLAFSPVSVPFALVSTAIGVWQVTRGVMQKAAAAAFTTANLKSAGPVKMGGVANVRILLDPKSSLEVTSAKVTFFTEEKAIYAAGTRRRTYRHEIHSWTLPIDVPKPLAQPYHHAVRIPVPRDLPPSFASTYNSVRSYCRLDVQIAKHPDLQVFEEIEILPEVADG